MASGLLLVVFTSLCAAAAGQHDNILNPYHASCSTTDNYTDGSQYKKNLDRLLATLPAAAGDNGWFYKGSAGAGADEAFGLIMCLADRDKTQCLDCLSRAPAGITTACPGSRDVSAAYEACVLRYSAAPIPATADLSYVASIVPFFNRTSDAVQAAWLPLMSRLTGEVASSPVRISSSSTPYNGSLEMYCLAQCSRDLNASECSRCISNYTVTLEKLFPNDTIGAIVGFSCYLRYQVGAFAVTMPPESAPPPPSQQPDPDTLLWLVIGTSTGSVSFFIILGISACLLLRQRWKKAKLVEETRRRERQFLDDEQEMEDEFEKGSGAKRFRYGELAIATDNFSDGHKLGEGGFGSVYRGFLEEMDLHVAVKRVSKASKQGRKEYASEVRIISRLRHRNLVQLTGWCHGGGELLLVYELMPNCSLDAHLYGTGNAVLPWKQRQEIVLGLGSALLYLHEEWEQCVVHRDIKPSNVMLDASFTAKLGDFGLARLVDHGRGSHTTTELAGTTGYMDPECTATGRFSTESDIYSFGVVLLEVACGRRPVVVLPDDSVVHLAQRVAELHGRGVVLHAADPRLNEEFDAGEMECVLLVGLWCTHQDRSLRPSIRQAVSALRFDSPLPSLPMPAVTSYVPAPAVGLLNRQVSSLSVADDI